MLQTWLLGVQIPPPLPQRQFKRDLPPALLARGLAAVAVGTSDVTLGDLPLNLPPRGPREQVSDIGPFGRSVAVVKIQYHKVALTAVEARVTQQVLDKSAEIVRHVDSGVSSGVGDVGGLVLLVMSAIPLGVALPTVTVQLSPRQVFESEFAHVLPLAARPCAAFLTPLLIHAIV